PSVVRAVSPSLLTPSLACREAGASRFVAFSALSAATATAFRSRGASLTPLPSMMMPSAAMVMGCSKGWAQDNFQASREAQDEAHGHNDCDVGTHCSAAFRSIERRCSDKGM